MKSITFAQNDILNYHLKGVPMPTAEKLNINLKDAFEKFKEKPLNPAIVIALAGALISAALTLNELRKRVKRVQTKKPEAYSPQQEEGPLNVDALRREDIDHYDIKPKQPKK